MWEHLAGAAVSGLLGGLSGSGGAGDVPGFIYERGLESGYKGATNRLNDLYGNPANYPQFGPPPFGVLNADTMNAVRGYRDVAGMIPGLTKNFADIVMQGAQGGGPAGQYADALFPFAGMAAGQAGQGAPQTSYSDVVSADANPALNQMLSGQADTAGLQGVLDTAFQPLLRNFEERIMPSVLQADDAYTGGQGGSGKTKIAQRLGEDLTNQMTEFAGKAGYSLQQDALDRRDRAAGLVTEGNLADAAQGLRSSIANADSSNNFLRSLLSGAGIGAQAGGTAGAQAANFAGMIPNIANLASQAPNLDATAAQVTQGYDDAISQYERNLWDYNENLPYQMTNQWLSALNSIAGHAQPTPYAVQGNPWLGAAHGILSSLPTGFNMGGGNSGGGNLLPGQNSVADFIDLNSIDFWS